MLITKIEVILDGHHLFDVKMFEQDTSKCTELIVSDLH